MEKKKRSLAPLWSLPSLIYVGIFLIIFPAGYNFYLSLFQYSFLTGAPPRFIGLDNYKTLLFESPEYINSLLVMLIIAFGALAVELVLAMMLALFLNQNFKGRAAVRTMMILPLGSIPVINAFMFKHLFFPDASPITAIFNYLGLAHGEIPWLLNSTLARIAVISVDVWQWTPFIMIILLAGLSSIPQSFYELARLDGLSNWKIFWRITLPKLKAPLALALLIRLMDLFKFFDGVFAMTQGGPQSATETASYFIFRMGFRTYNIGWSAAASIIIWAIIFVIAILFIRQFFSQEKATA